MNAIGKTHAGVVREKNQDYFFVFNKSGSAEYPMSLFIVADGMGGHRGGEIASETAVTEFCAFARETPYENGETLDFLMAGLKRANKSVIDKAQTNAALYGMGTTFTACTIRGSRLHAAHIGDSRLYHITQHAAKQISNDHSLVEEMVRRGQITAEEAKVHPKKNILLKALGIEDNPEAEGILYDVEENGVILICSDGLTNMLNNDEIMRIVNNRSSLEGAANTLIDEANNAGGLDNITVVLIEVTP